MRKLITDLLARPILVCAIALPAGASQQGPGRSLPAASSVTPYYLCDGAGSGSCKPLIPDGAIYDGTPIFAIGRNSGAWRWSPVEVRLTTPPTFTYPPLDNQLGNGQPVWELELYANPSHCNGNSAGADIIKIHNGTASELWVWDTSNDYFVNICARTTRTTGKCCAIPVEEHS